MYVGAGRDKVAAPCVRPAQSRPQMCDSPPGIFSPVLWIRDILGTDPDPRIRTTDFRIRILWCVTALRVLAVHTHTHTLSIIYTGIVQCCGSVTFCYESRNHWLPGPDPALFIRDFQDAIKNFFLRIYEILVQIRIRGSIPLTIGSGSRCGSESYYFRQWPSRPS